MTQQSHLRLLHPRDVWEGLLVEERGRGVGMERGVAEVRGCYSLEGQVVLQERQVCVYVCVCVISTPDHLAS